MICIVSTMPEAGLLRIGELSRRAGVSPELLRAWERRYGLLRPTRTPGGLRVYSSEDLRRVQEMQRHLSDGARGRGRQQPSRAEPRSSPRTPRSRPRTFAPSSHTRSTALTNRRRRRFSTGSSPSGTVEAALSDVILPYLRELGARWEREEVTVAQEHFASNVLRGRLLGLARVWGRGVGPIAMLACLPGEQHELGLIASGLAFRSHGWRISYFGGNTPLETVEGAAKHLEPRLIALSP